MSHMTPEGKKAYLAAVLSPAQGFKEQLPPTHYELENREEVQKVDLGFQPLDLAVQWRSDKDGFFSWIALTDYFGTSVMLLEIRICEQRLHLTGLQQIDYVYRGEERVRLFSDLDPIKGVNRCDSVNFAPDTGFWVGRNGRRELVHLVPPCGNYDRHWIDKTVVLPGEQHPDNWRLSCRVTPEALYSLEGTRRNQGLFVMKYPCQNLGFLPGEKVLELPPGMHGMAVHPNTGELWFLTRGQAAGKPVSNPGVYKGNKLVVPGIWGSGLGFLPNGGLLIARYGLDEQNSLWGIPGALFYVPPEIVNNP